MTTVVNHLIYDAFGNVPSETYLAVDSLFLFTARPFDPDTGLQNNLNRWYDSRVGRWLSEDPIGFAGGDGNLYRYLFQSPITLVDPVGLACQRIQRKYNIQLKNWRGALPLIGPIGLYGSIGLKAEADFGAQICGICCPNGGPGKEVTVYARVRFGLYGSVTGGWEGSVPFGGGIFGGYIGLRGKPGRTRMPVVTTASRPVTTGHGFLKCAVWLMHDSAFRVERCFDFNTVDGSLGRSACRPMAKSFTEVWAAACSLTRKALSARN